MFNNQIRYLFKESNISINESSIEKFNSFLNLLVKYNDEFDLSRIKKIDDIIIKHFIDSLYVNKLFKLPDNVLDIGTGAGFPGIPLAIVNPKLNFILAEPRSKRVDFLNIVINELSLNNVVIYPHLVTEKSFFDVNAVITRAFESIDKTLLRINHFLKQDAIVIFMKGPKASDEIINHTDYELIFNKNYVLPDTKYERKLIVYKKTSNSLKKMFFIDKHNNCQDGIAIISEKNKNFIELKKIAKNPKKYSQTIVSGKKIIKELIQNKLQIVHKIILHSGYSESDSLLLEFINNFEFNKKLILKKSLFNSIDFLFDNQPSCIINTPDINTINIFNKEKYLMIPFQDPVNAGTVIRSALAFGIKNIIFNQNAVYPYHPKVIRTSSGAIFQCNIFKLPPLEKINLNIFNIPVIALDMKGKPIIEYNFPEYGILIPGIEGSGLPKNININKIAIPIAQNIDSLNATIATSIALYEWHKL